MEILFVEPQYYSKYPPLGLLKLASYHRSRGDKISLVRGLEQNLNTDPDIVYITSLFTFAWAPVHKAIEYYQKKFPGTKISVGGLYASIMPDRVKFHYPFVDIHVGLHESAEQYMPAYDILNTVEKWKNWDSSILFSTRGCIRNCPFCVVPKLEGKIRVAISDVQNFIHPDHKQVILWDNNFLASPQWRKTIIDLKETGLKIDFNQGLDARLMDEEKAQHIADLNMPTIRMAYDFKDEKTAVERAVEHLEEAGIRRRKILFYTLFNFYNPGNEYGDTPESFLEIIQDIANLGCVSYPMRYEPITSLKKNQFVSPLWAPEQLEAIADARRVIGFGGAFPPYQGLVDKFASAKTFDEAFKLRPKQSKDDASKSMNKGLEQDTSTCSGDTVSPCYS